MARRFSGKSATRNVSAAAAARRCRSPASTRTVRRTARRLLQGAARGAARCSVLRVELLMEG